MKESPVLFPCMCLSSVSDSNAFCRQCVAWVNTSRWFPHAHTFIRSIYLHTTVVTFDGRCFPSIQHLTTRGTKTFYDLGKKKGKLPLIDIILCWKIKSFLALWLPECFLPRDPLSVAIFGLFYRLGRLYFTAAFNGNQTTADSINTQYRGKICLQRTDGVHPRNLYHMIEVSTDPNIIHLLLFLIMLNSARKNASYSQICSDSSTEQNTNNKLWLRPRSLWWLMNSIQMDPITA